MSIAEAVTLVDSCIQDVQKKFLAFTWSLTWLFFWACVCTSPTDAHPISQGSMEITVLPDRIDLHAIISHEEILVAAALGGQENSIGPEAIRKHADYLLAHLHISADGQALAGRILEVPSKFTGQLPYRFEYRLEGAIPQRIELRQDILREFEFAPGNAWEASYIVRIIVHGQASAEGLLFTFREPLVFQGDGIDGLDQPRMTVAFMRHGIDHILSGYDHLLFVGALVLAVAGWWDLVKVITGFTLAHSFTLTLAALDIFRLPSGIVEPMIALSIVAAAVQNIFWPRHSRGWERLLLAFGFGLFHGLGFAGGLLDAMSDMQISGAILAIASFSVGVEIGHQLVVLPAFYGLTLLRRYNAGQSRHAQRYGSALISLFGLAYLYASLR
ncbi:MAG: HupE/UreJ family protein [Methylobacter sp.]